MRIASTGYDNLIEDIVEYAYKGLTTYLGTDIGLGVYREYHNNSDIILLHQRNVVGLSGFYKGEENAFSVKYDGNARNASFQIKDDVVNNQINVILKNGITTTDIPVDLSLDISDLVDDINAVTDWTASIINNGPNIFLKRMRPINAKSRVTALMFRDEEYNYTMNEPEGVIELSQIGRPDYPDAFKITYAAGFNPLPDDIKLVIIEVVRKVYQKTLQKSAGLNAEGLGDYWYKMNDKEAMSLIDFNDHKHILSRYYNWAF